MTTRVLDRPKRVRIRSDEEKMHFRCPICKAITRGSEHMTRHLVAKHEISKRQASFFSHKLVEWRNRGSDIIMFLQNRQNAQTYH
jgi:uncharacterized C2H2 Zn-finger protein